MSHLVPKTALFNLDPRVPRQKTLKMTFYLDLALLDDFGQNHLKTPLLKVELLGTFLGQ